jgi:hypothetical protein
MQYALVYRTSDLANAQKNSRSDGAPAGLAKEINAGEWKARVHLAVIVQREFLKNDQWFFRG